MTRYYVQLANGKYLAAPPVEGSRNVTVTHTAQAYEFGPSAANVAKGLKGAQVVSVTQV